MARITKQEKLEIERKERELRNKRSSFLRAIDNYEKDVEATERYYRINKMQDKFKNEYSEDLNNEEKEKLMRRYEALNNIKVTYDKNDPEYRTWNFIRLMKQSAIEEYNRKNLITSSVYIRDGIWNDEIIWSDNQINTYIKLMKEFGYKYLIFTDNSSGAMEAVATLVKKGAKVVDTCTTVDYEDTVRGLVFDITEIELEENKEEVKEESDGE